MLTFPTEEELVKCYCYSQRSEINFVLIFFSASLTCMKFSSKALVSSSKFNFCLPFPSLSLVWSTLVPFILKISNSCLPLSVLDQDTTKPMASVPLMLFCYAFSSSQKHWPYFWTLLGPLVFHYYKLFSQVVLRRKKSVINCT